MFNNVQFWSFLRQILLALGGGLVAKGYLDSGTLEAIVGAIITIATAAYGLWVRRKAGIVAAAAALPEVTQIVTTPEIAAKVDDPSVTAR
ncbi:MULTISPECIES: hypothetical protein [unclassified Bosea (in: a-proteobacteria)]|uniref:Pam3-gp28 family putative phage holin n=1 Tax=unclassified Bosea (in: a-proteobacteria) TaxID=2653178 RepID=UPI000F7E04C2|nr:MULTISPECIES: hypothetical protein [unclassified Bosea (in: a-proteobacteria)]